MNTDKTKQLPFAHYSNPYYKVPRTEYCSEPDKLETNEFGAVRHPDCLYTYSDHLERWNNDLSEHATIAANDSCKPKNTPAWIEEYLSHYYGKKVDLVHVLQGVNLSDGHPYRIYGTRRQHEEIGE